MKVSSPQFKQKSVIALADPRLRQALGQSRKGFVNKRAELVGALPEFEQLRETQHGVQGRAQLMAHA